MLGVRVAGGTKAGAAPALLTFLIQIFVPESHKWKEAQKQAPARPLTELFGSAALRRTALLAICFASVVRRIRASAEPLTCRRTG